MNEYEEPDPRLQWDEEEYRYKMDQWENELCSKEEIEIEIKTKEESKWTKLHNTDQ